MTTKQLIPNNGKLLNILKGNAKKQKATGTISVLKICIEKEKILSSSRYDCTAPASRTFLSLSFVMIELRILSNPIVLNLHKKIVCKTKISQ